MLRITFKWVLNGEMVVDSIRPYSNLIRLEFPLKSKSSKLMLYDLQIQLFIFVISVTIPLSILRSGNSSAPIAITNRTLVNRCL
jgi:hypothetical protein